MRHGSHLFFSLNLALGRSLACLHAPGALLRRNREGRATRVALLRSGLRVMVVGSASAGVGFAIGRLVTALSG
jgi:hypothetical protein